MYIYIYMFSVFYSLFLCFRATNMTYRYVHVCMHVCGSMRKCLQVIENDHITHEGTHVFICMWACTRKNVRMYTCIHVRMYVNYVCENTRFSCWGFMVPRAQKNALQFVK